MPGTSTSSAKIQGTLCEFWFDENDIFHMAALDKFITLEELNSDYELVKAYLNGRVVPVVYDATKLHPIERKIRLRLEEILIENFSALGVVSKSKIGLVVARIFFSLSNNSVPKQIFNKKSQAVKWILSRMAA